MTLSYIKTIEYYLPEGKLTNDDLAAQYAEWSVDKIEQKTGISERRIAGPQECSSDLGVAAARKLFESAKLDPSAIDFLLFCTQSPDYFLPTTACLLQQRLGIPTNCGALDFNLGCSGFVYGVGLAKGLIESGQARNVLLLTAETYSKFIHPGDKSVRTIFGDAAAATWIAERGGEESETEPWIGPVLFGTDGSGAENLIVKTGGMRNPSRGAVAAEIPDSEGNVRSASNLYMNGPEIMSFTLKAVPKSVHALLERAGKNLEEIDLFVFHQANQYMLEHLRKKMKLPENRFYISMRHCGNTVSSTIPIALRDAQQQGKLKPGDTVMIVGFGVGYSWASALIRWGEEA